MEEKFEMLWKLFDEMVAERPLDPTQAIHLGIDLIDAQARCGWRPNSPETQFRESIDIDLLIHELAKQFPVFFDQIPTNVFSVYYSGPARHFVVDMDFGGRLGTVYISARALLEFETDEDRMAYAVARVKKFLDRHTQSAGPPLAG